MLNNNFIKKFYWLIFTAVFSLFVFLLTSSCKRGLKSTEYLNPNNYQFDSSIAFNDSLRSHIEIAGNDMTEIIKVFQDPGDYNDQQFDKLIKRAITYESVVKELIIEVDDLLFEYNGLQSYPFNAVKKYLTIVNNI